MSEQDEASAPQPRHVRLIQIVDGMTFVLFVAAIVKPYWPILATAVAWSFLVLLLPLIFRGAFTLAIPRHANLSNEPPRQIAALTMMAIALGIAGTVGSFRVPITYALGDAVILGVILFVAALFVDPRLRTKAQVALLIVQCAFWTLGARLAIVGFISA